MYSEQDDIMIQQYETGNYEIKEELKEEVEKILKRRERRENQGKFW